MLSAVLTPLFVVSLGYFNHAAHVNNVYKFNIYLQENSASPLQRLIGQYCFGK
jgi:hypothetical protein